MVSCSRGVGLIGLIFLLYLLELHAFLGVRLAFGLALVLRASFAPASWSRVALVLICGGLSRLAPPPHGCLSQLLRPLRASSLAFVWPSLSGPLCFWRELCFALRCSPFALWVRGRFFPDSCSSRFVWVSLLPSTCSFSCPFLRPRTMFFCLPGDVLSRLLAWAALLGLYPSSTDPPLPSPRPSCLYIKLLPPISLFLRLSRSFMHVNYPPRPDLDFYPPHMRGSTSIHTLLACRCAGFIAPLSDPLTRPSFVWSVRSVCLVAPLLLIEANPPAVSHVSA